MSESPEIPQKKSGYLVALSAVEFLLTADVVSLNETIQNADDVELAFAVSWLAGTLGAYMACTSPDPVALIAQCRRELLDG